MNRFFEHQERARRNTTALVALMALAVGGIGSALYLVLAIAIAVRRAYHPWFDGLQLDAGLWLRCVAGTALFVLGASLLRFASLGSGANVAESMGGRLVSGAPRDALERRLLNVVEEIAIASGVPVPRVYVLEVEAGINAFAAGWKLDDAVIGVTRGALEQLTREELQGVIAHEFSHVLNGDMRLNLRLVGVVYGIVCIALAGRMMIEAVGRGRGFGRRRSDAAFAFAFVGALLFLIGSIGELCSKLIKAAVSRQREFLADASAVQFTRNPQGIASALRKIGGFVFGARISVASAEETSHIFFGEIVTRSFAGMLATHPPLSDRIRRIDPSFDGRFPELAAGTAQPEESAARFAVGSAARTTAAPAHDPAGVVDQVGRFDADSALSGSRLLEGLPPALREATGNGYSACAIVCALLLSDEPAARAAMLQRIAAELGAPFARDCERFTVPLQALPRRDRLPLVALVAPALHALSRQQRAAWKRTLDALIAADGTVSIFEYLLGYLIERQSGEPRGQARPRTLGAVRSELELLLSLLAYAGAQHQDEAAHAFQTAAARMSGQPLALLPNSARLLSALASALDALRALPPPLRARVVDACAHAALANQQLNEDEWTLLRAVCAALHCPLPPLDP